MATDSRPDTIAMRTALRDLIARSAIPAAWVGRDPADIARGLADVLVHALNLDVAFVRLLDPTGGDATEVTRGASAWSFPDWLKARLQEIDHLAGKEIFSEVVGAESYHGIAVPIGVNGQDGLVVAACRRDDFPGEIDQLLLSVAANHAAMASQNTRLRTELDAKVQELRHAHDDLELKVAQRAREITRLSRDLKERDKKIRRLVDGNIVGVLVATLDGQVSDANDAFLNMLGYNRDDLISGRLRWTELTPPEWRAATDQALARIAAEGTCHVYEKEYLRKDGSRVPVLLTGAAVEDTGGEIVAFVLDLTERKRAEQERERLRQLQADLAHVNRVTTMGELAASLAHEIKQPMAAARIHASVCLSALADNRLDCETARDAASQLVKDVAWADDVIDRTGALFKKESTERERVNINAVIREMALLLQQQASTSSIVVRTELADDIPDVMADRVQLQQVFLNLMLNAIDAMKAIGGELTITSRLREVNELLIGVSDTGVGLPVDNPERIFESFVTTKPHGTGMGLTITRSIVESHGGRLWATANAGPGATFRFTLPSDTSVPPRR